MTGRFEADLPHPCRKSLDRWLRDRDVPRLRGNSRIEWSQHLTRSLGRCYPDRRLIRISSHLQSAPDGLLQEVLCHEMAHLAARELHGRNVRPHGPE
jgi:SprT protein